MPANNDFMTGTELGEKLLTAVRQMNAGQVGRVTRVPLSDAARARASLQMSQREFARLMGVSVRTLQEWEQARRSPSGAARTLLRVAIEAPQVLRPIAERMNANASAS